MRGATMFSGILVPEVAAAPCWKSSTGNALRSKFPASAAPSIAARARGAS